MTSVQINPTWISVFGFSESMQRVWEKSSKENQNYSEGENYVHT